MRYLVAIDLDDAQLTDAYGGDPNTTDVLAGSGFDDLVASLDARADEFYCGPHDIPVRGTVVAVADFSGKALGALLDAADVGAEGIEPEDVRHHVEGSLITFRQMFEVGS